jgi:UMF1 family MFS transporter
VSLREAVRGLRRTLGELVKYRNALLVLVAFLLYNDGISSIIRLATVYGAELRFGEGVLVGSILLVQFLGVPFTLLFGKLAARVETTNAILVSATRAGPGTSGSIEATGSRNLSSATPRAAIPSVGRKR